jgi:hypothetical protein
LSEALLKSNFGKVWPKFLEFQISRSKRCVDIAGSVNGYLILQVVAYHNLSLLSYTASGYNYSVMREAWEIGWPETLVNLPYILNYAAIAELTGIDKETTRRAVLKLEKNQWLTVDKKLGITYSPTEGNQKKLLELNEWELTFFGKMVELAAAKL